MHILEITKFITEDLENLLGMNLFTQITALQLLPGA